jgi:hypothetical protein
MAGPLGPSTLASSTEQFLLIQRIRRRHNAEPVEGRSTEDEEAIKELVTWVLA